MASYNKVIMMGNLTRDPKLNTLPSGTSVVEFSLATSRKWKNKDDQQQEEVCFADCKCFGKMAETINQYCEKGKPLMIEGRLSFEKWEEKDGKKRSKHYITIESFTFVGGKGDSSGTSAPKAAMPGNVYATAPIAEADIPF